MNRTKGTINVGHTIWCGLCSHWEQLTGTRPYTTRKWRALGWEYTRLNGWVCPACIKDPPPGR